VRAIDGLAEQPLSGSALKGELRGLRRIRVGRYRVVYEVLDGELIVLVVRVAHRREAYRRR
jgi:mRNA interferase RelE/StbE